MERSVQGPDSPSVDELLMELEYLQQRSRHAASIADDALREFEAVFNDPQAAPPPSYAGSTTPLCTPEFT
eukprot:4233026-Pyramimonas_sp.AAC.1